MFPHVVIFESESELGRVITHRAFELGTREGVLRLNVASHGRLVGARKPANIAFKLTGAVARFAQPHF